VNLVTSIQEFIKFSVKLVVSSSCKLPSLICFQEAGKELVFVNYQCKVVVLQKLAFFWLITDSWLLIYGFCLSGNGEPNCGVSIVHYV
jgi:hypothetical protein